MGVYQVERIVVKQIQGGKSEFFIQWKDYSLAENTWEPTEHLPGELIAVFESRIVDQFGQMNVKRDWHFSSRRV